MTTNDAPTCPHHCGPLEWLGDCYICPICGDEWGEEVEEQ